MSVILQGEGTAGRRERTSQFQFQVDAAPLMFQFQVEAALTPTTFQFQVATGASWAVVDFVIVVFLSRRAIGPEAGGGGTGAAGSRRSGKVQPQVQVATGPTGAGVDVHCWVASCASIDSMALTSVFMGRFLSHRCLTPREAGHWSGAAV